MIIETAAIISFASWLGGKIADKGFDTIYDKLFSKHEIDKKFVEAIKFVAKKLEKKYPDILANSITYFFTKDEVFDELCKLLFVNQNVNSEVISKSFDNTTLPGDFIIEFIGELKNKLSTIPELLDIIANKELFIAVNGISKNIEEISYNSTLSSKEISDIKKILEKQFREKFNLISFKTLYLKNLLNNINEINFIGLGIDPSIKKGKRKELDSIFVKPFFRLSSKFHINIEEKFNKENQEKTNWDRDETLISFQNIFDRPYNYVILGNPGSGKSLLIKSIILYISTKVNQFKNEEILSYIPFRIELKNYLSYKKNKGGNLLKYLTNVLEEEYSVPNVLEENLSYVLKKEKAILFLDGLDEIFDINDKINIKNDIENFHNLFPNIKSITTSRYVGYTEARLDEEKFCELDMLSFNDEQIKEYVSKWYTLEEDNCETRNSEISDFVSKMNNVDNELLSNPLLLSLIVILYRNNLKIPESKLEIYQSCTNTLVDKWDASKNLDIQIDEKILQKKEPIFSDLAFWQYETLSSTNTEVTFYKAKNVVAKSLIKKKVADEDNAAQLAEIFLDYAQKRSIYFDNNFTHKTFLEYYTAFWIYSNIEMKHNIVERSRIIKKYITNPFWSIVLELLLNMIDKDQPDSEILDSIIKENINNSKSYPFLIHIIPSLKNISYEVQKLVYFNSIKYLIKVKSFSEEEKQKTKDLFRRIQRNVVSQSQEKILINAILNIEIKFWNKNLFILINELALTLEIKSLEFNFSVIKNSEKYINETEKDCYLFQIDNFGKTKNIEDVDYLSTVMKFLNLFGAKKIFSDHASVYNSYYFGGFIHFYFYHQFKKENISDTHNNLQKFKKYKLEVINLLEFILDRRMIPNFDKESIQYLFKYIDNITEESEKVFYIFLLRLCFIEKQFSSSNTNLQIDNFTISIKTKNLFKKLIKTDSNKKALEMTTNHYSIKDKKVLQLIKTLDNKIH